MSVVRDTDRWLIPLLLAGICSAGMAVLVAGIALALGTTGHDWYAAWRMTLVEAMVTVGFDEYGTVEYRMADGTALTLRRYYIVNRMVEPWQSRRLILSLAGDRALLGACTGAVLSAMWLAARVAVGLRRLLTGRRAVVEPAPRARQGYAGRMHHPDGWSDGELVEALARRSGRLGVLLVSPAEVERLAGSATGGVGPRATPRESLPSASAPALPPSEIPEPAPAAAREIDVPAPADPEGHPAGAKADRPDDSKAGSNGRGPSRKLY